MEYFSMKRISWTPHHENPDLSVLTIEINGLKQVVGGYTCLSTAEKRKQELAEEWAERFNLELV